jgi:hypothetical protein
MGIRFAVTLVTSFSGLVTLVTLAIAVMADMGNGRGRG